MRLRICALDEISRFIGTATHVISIIDPEDVEFLPKMSLKKANHLVLPCHDVVSVREAMVRKARMPRSSCVAPTKAMVKLALEFGRQLPADHFILIHCHQGISRSTAIALALLCERQPEIRETDVLQQVLALRREASPNRLIVAYADQLLGRRGRMNRAVSALYGKI